MYRHARDQGPPAHVSPAHEPGHHFATNRPARQSGPTFPQKLALHETAKKFALARIKQAFNKKGAGKLTDEQLDGELHAAIHAYQRGTCGWCRQCGPQDDSSYTPASCTKCVVARVRAPRQAVPHREHGSVERYGKNVWKRKQCEECGQKQAIWGLMSEGVKRWCGPCGKPHGAYDMVNKKCEDCKILSATFCLPSEGKQRWCGGCAKAHGAVSGGQKRLCEDCNVKKARWGMPGARKQQWCAPCAQSGAHPGAIDPHRANCEDCQAKKAVYRMPDDPTVGPRSSQTGQPTMNAGRWCAQCAMQHHPGAINSNGNPPALKSPKPPQPSGPFLCKHCNREFKKFGFVTAHEAKCLQQQAAAGAKKKASPKSKKRGAASSSSCPACRGEHRAHTCEQGPRAKKPAKEPSPPAEEVDEGELSIWLASQLGPGLDQSTFFSSMGTGFDDKIKGERWAEYQIQNASA